MTEDKETRWQSLPPFVVVLLLAVGSYWWMPWPLYGERPPQSYAGIPVEGVQQADARLWQDPFAVAQRHKERKPAPAFLVAGQGEIEYTRPPGVGARDLDWLGRVAAEKCTEGTPCHVLGVMVFGGPYVGAEESRRAKRYAVLAGLSSHGFIPEDTEHIGYVEPGEGLPPVLPFEWLRGDGNGQRLLLLWLDEDALTREIYRATGDKLESKMLPRLSLLLKPLENEHIRSPKIVGPASSGTLSKLAGEWEAAERSGWASLEDGEMLQKTLWYSASATSDKAWAATVPGENERKLPIVRVIARDSELAKKLVDELKGRGLKSRDTVALIGQLDTAYSRNLMELLEKELDNSFKRPERVQVISAHYLRGIDGEKPREKEKGDDKGEGRKDDNGAPREDKVEKPVGDSQIDYLRRLTVELARQHQAFKPSGEIRAVGILGNDYHDKLLVLKALRHAFPDAVFFTTDLEASMLHPLDNRHTRNLVVASAFGLELEPALQAGFAPFRTSYQTASYLATRLALIDSSSDAGPHVLSQEDIDERISPLLYEIGHSAPVRLDNPSRPEAKESRGCGPGRQDWIECKDWQPARENRPARNTLLGSALATVAGLSLAAMLSGRFRRLLLRRWRIIAVGIAAVAVSAAWLIASLPSPLGEPFSWVEGVSTWPTEILRAVAVALSVQLFLSGIRRLRRCDEATHRRFFHGAEQEGRGAGDETYSLKHPGDADISPVVDIWRLYRARQLGVDQLTGRLADKRIEVVPSWRKRHFVLQNFKPVLLYLLVGFGLTLALGSPHPPARGEVMLALDRIVLFAAVVSFLMVLFFSLNASRRAIWLARSLSKRSSWPDTTLARFGWHKKLDRAYFDDFLDVQLLAAATSGVQRLVYYPFAIFFLLVLSRTRLLDGWHIPVSLYLIFAVAGFLMLTAAVLLRRAAEESRSRAIERINLFLLNVQGLEEAGAKALEQQMQSMITLIKGVRKGAYAPIGEQPIVRAVLGLASGVYAITLLEWIKMAGL